MASPPTSRAITFNVPMALTWARIAMIPLVVGIYYLPDAWLAPHWKNVAACWIFILAAITDALDGYLARRYGAVSKLGEFLDPVADKLMVSAALIVLIALGRVDSLVALVIIGREITVSALREWMAKIGKSSSVAVNSMGKIKTIAQMTAIPMLLFHDPPVRSHRSASDRHTADLCRRRVDGLLDVDLFEARMAASERTALKAGPSFAILRGLVRE